MFVNPFLNLQLSWTVISLKLFLFVSFQLSAKVLSYPERGSRKCWCCRQLQHFQLPFPIVYKGLYFKFNMPISFIVMKSSCFKTNKIVQIELMLYRRTACCNFVFMSHSDLFEQIWFGLIVRLLEMDHCFIGAPTSAPHSSNCLARSSAQVSVSIYTFSPLQ